MERRLNQDEAEEEYNLIREISKDSNDPGASSRKISDIKDAAELIDDESKQSAKYEVKNPGLISVTTALFYLEKIVQSRASEAETSAIKFAPKHFVEGIFQYMFDELLKPQKVEPDKTALKWKCLTSLKDSRPDIFATMLTREVWQQAQDYLSFLYQNKDENREVISELRRLFSFNRTEIATAIVGAAKRNLEAGTIVAAVNILQGQLMLPEVISIAKSDREIVELLRQQIAQLRRQQAKEKDGRRQGRIGENINRAEQIIQVLG